MNRLFFGIQVQVILVLLMDFQDYQDYEIYFVSPQYIGERVIQAPMTNQRN